MEKKQFDQLLAKLSKLKSKVLLKDRDAIQDDTNKEDDEEEEELFKLAAGIAPYHRCARRSLLAAVACS
ncbi:MAG: hypothetical protein MHM6MM_009613 [Cercozoa sp. M6MM]